MLASFDGMMRARSQSKHDCAGALQATTMGATKSGPARSLSRHSRDSGNNALVPDSLSKYPPSVVRPPSGSCAFDRLSTRHLRALLVGWYEVGDIRGTFEGRTPKNLL
jgi:hypothetical protein